MWDASLENIPPGLGSDAENIELAVRVQDLDDLADIEFKNILGAYGLEDSEEEPEEKDDE
jgi:hypothetical protein